ncbi:hypothetical protein EJ03DRAFT_162367 [Teratosphaeria nubilosa]|uniref:Uncharacterized protein n=1 Tax=Teratosphaeria nubilosa TaxID=161662 RepID=A0A6G1L3E8_9PEZI|nr:hypothetical protein EJ03DRAFT_162367 [Teratosphaeria nubilosa]
MYLDSSHKLPFPPLAPVKIATVTMLPQRASPPRLLRLLRLLRLPQHAPERTFTCTPHITAKKYTNDPDFHQPSLGGSSLGHLVSELSATRPGMESLRQGQTMSEEDRTHARSIAKWIVGIPFAVGGSILAWTFASRLMGRGKR